MGAAGRGLLGFVLLIVTATAAYGGWANEYAAFGNDSLTFQGFATVSGGPAGSNGNVIHQGGIAHFDGLYGGGALNPAPPTTWNARQNVHGNVIFNSSVTINSLSNIDGSIHSGGAVSMGGNSIGKGVGGNVIATGPVTIESYNTIGGNIVAGGDATLVNGVNVAGNIGANGNVSLGVDSHVTGVVTRSGTLTLGGFSTVGGQAVGTVSPNPTAYTPVVLPPATAFTSGGANQNLAVFADVTLAPGSYGAVTLNGSNKLRLSGGNYYFDSIASPGTFADLHFDLTQGPINVFVTGDIAFDRVTAYVNGVRYDSAPAALASDVYFESHGDINMTGRFFGALYAPQGDITTGTIGTVIGSMIAGRHLTVGSATSVTDGGATYVASSYMAAAVPEPSMLALAFLACACLVWRALRRA